MLSQTRLETHENNYIDYLTLRVIDAVFNALQERRRIYDLIFRNSRLVEDEDGFLKCVTNEERCYYQNTSMKIKSFFRDAK